ncbi:uncharacterized protein LOC132703943 isoform X2 [Cylas formicarius]|nr:uncharacterized protein LOC132703943 isoform X2 [Cylas formicarius]
MDSSNLFMEWAIEYNLLPLSARCPNAQKDPKCESPLALIFADGLNDLYQLKCSNCDNKESLRKHSIFYGLQCNIRSAIRILYGWVKGIDLDLMANILGLDIETVGTLYNRASRFVRKAVTLHYPTLMTLGGEGVVVLVDIYPIFLQKAGSQSHRCSPILCISEIGSLPQNYWLEPLEYWDNNDPFQVKEIKAKILDIITNLVKPKSMLVLPSQTTFLFSEEMETLNKLYINVKYVDDLLDCNHRNRSLGAILDAIWKKPVEVCEQAQFFNPNYINQYFVREFWIRTADVDAFGILIDLISIETVRGNIDKLCL